MGDAPCSVWRLHRSSTGGRVPIHGRPAPRACRWLRCAVRGPEHVPPGVTADTRSCGGCSPNPPTPALVPVCHAAGSPHTETQAGVGGSPTPQGSPWSYIAQGSVEVQGPEFQPHVVRLWLSPPGPSESNAGPALWLPLELSRGLPGGPGLLAENCCTSSNKTSSPLSRAFQQALRGISASQAISWESVCCDLRAVGLPTSPESLLRNVLPSLANAECATLLPRPGLQL